MAYGLAIACSLNGFTPQRAAAQVPFSPFQPVRQRETAKPLARDVNGPPTVSQRLDGTAFFVDDLGHMLTARHAVADCARIIVNKEGRSVAARVVRAWLNPDGTVERVTFPAFDDAGATEDLRTILKRGNVGEAPPPEMLQPLNLRFSLNLRKP